MGAIHPKVVWAGLASVAFCFLVYELEYHSFYRFNGTEAAFATAVVAFLGGYWVRSPAEGGRPLIHTSGLAVPLPTPTLAVGGAATKPAVPLPVATLPVPPATAPPTPPKAAASTEWGR